MPMYEMTRPHGGNRGERAEAATLGGGAASHNTDFTMKNHRRQAILVCDFLQKGKRNAVCAEILARKLGFRNARELSRKIERERQDGLPICATPGGDKRGYYVAETPQELYEYIKRLDHRLRAVQKTRDACAEAHRRMTGQQIMEGWNG